MDPDKMKRILILSDIHGNLAALESVLKAASDKEIDGIMLLGDLIDYGPDSNEVIKRISGIPKERIIVNIWGNHEKAIMHGDFGRFSSKRGELSAKFTKSRLTEASLDYLKAMDEKGMSVFFTGGKKCLAVHGSLEDFFWKSIGAGETSLAYREFDYVFSGHSHIPHAYQQFYESDNRAFRYKKRTVFINPGSVGQPRNHNPNAHFAIWDADNGSIELLTVEYDIESEVKRFTDDVDVFYKERIRTGI